MSRPLHRHSAFYRFTPLLEPHHVAELLRERCRELLGNIVVAAEGISGAVAGPAPAVDAFERWLTEESACAPGLTGMAFIHSDSERAPFARMKVHLKPEIVAFGVDGVTAPARRDTHLDPLAWRDLLAREDLVLLDNRNSFEYRLGHFNRAMDPGVANFRDFAAFVLAHADGWREHARPVAMYCTGGIRCEKTCSWMQAQGLEVYQLDGGILNYFRRLPDADRDWSGECFVFDKRIAVDTRLQPTATRAEDVYDSRLTDEAWRLQRAWRLAGQPAA